jgi:hypothetical protein
VTPPSSLSHIPLMTFYICVPVSATPTCEINERGIVGKKGSVFFFYRENDNLLHQFFLCDASVDYLVTLQPYLIEFQTISYGVM